MLLFFQNVNLSGKVAMEKFIAFIIKNTSGKQVGTGYSCCAVILHVIDGDMTQEKFINYIHTGGLL